MGIGLDGAKPMPLSQLPIGCSAEVESLAPDTEMRWRLLDLGLTPGTRVEAVRRSPLGDPILYRFRSTKIALRRPDADLVQVRPLEKRVSACR